MNIHISDMDFTNDTKKLVKGDWYLLRAPSWSESGYVIAQLDRFNGSEPVFIYEVDGRDIDDDDIHGWLPL